MSKSHDPMSIIFDILDSIFIKSPPNLYKALKSIEKLKQQNCTKLLSTPTKFIQYNDLEVYIIELAASLQDTSVLKELLEIGIPLQNAIYYALRNNNTEAVILLKSKGAILPQNISVQHLNEKICIGIHGTKAPSVSKLENTLKQVDKACGSLDETITALRLNPETIIKEAIIQANNSFKDKYGIDYLKSNIKYLKQIEAIKAIDCQSIMEQIQVSENELKPSTYIQLGTLTALETEVSTMGNESEVITENI